MFILENQQNTYVASYMQRVAYTRNVYFKKYLFQGNITNHKTLKSQNLQAITVIFGKLKKDYFDNVASQMY